MLSVRLRHRFPGDFRGGASLDMAFDAPLPGVVAVFGPSGAGKSSLLAAIAGLLRPDHAEIRLGDAVLAAPGRFLPPERRRIGMVFQQARLFPHLRVDANLRYGARRRGPGQSPRQFDEVVALLDLGHLLARPPHTLSGGEAQRVAIGRALLSAPALLALDEPLSALDAPRRAEILPYLARLRQAGLPMLYVTHAIEEAVRLADTLLLVEDGRTRGCGPLADLLAQGAAGFGQATLLDGHVVRVASGAAQLEAGGWRLILPAAELREGARVRVLIAARDVLLMPADAPGGLAVEIVADATPGVVPNRAPDVVPNRAPDIVALRPCAPSRPVPHPLRALPPPGAVLAPGTRMTAMVNPHAIRAFSLPD